MSLLTASWARLAILSDRPRSRGTDRANPVKVHLPGRYIISSYMGYQARGPGTSLSERDFALTKPHMTNAGAEAGACLVKEYSYD